MSLNPTQIKDSIENLEKAMLSIMARVKAIEDLNIDNSLKAINKEILDIKTAAVKTSDTVNTLAASKPAPPVIPPTGISTSIPKLWG